MLQLFILLIFLNENVLSFNYCSINCSPKLLHTVCLNPKCKLATNCVKVTKDQQKFRDTVLKIHNELRRKIALGQEKRKHFGTAANMKALIYDEQLEYIAQCHLNSCARNHDKCRKTKKFDQVGQNLYFGGPIFTESQLRRAITKWYDELIRASPNQIKSFNPLSQISTIGHFTQLIWAKTTHIGCARVYDKSISKKLMPYSFACNYGPAGNIIGQPIFIKGRPCSKCDKGCSTAFPGLCK